MDYGTGDADSHRNESVRAKGNLLQPPRLYDAGGGHKRSLSGSILSRFPFFRPATDQLSDFKTNGTASKVIAQENRAPENVTAHVKSRKQKGSLRKKALLGTGNARLEARDRSNTQVKSPKRSDEGRRRYSLSQDGIDNEHEGDGNDEDIDINPASSGASSPMFYENHHVNEAAISHANGWSSSTAAFSTSGRLSNEETAENNQRVTMPTSSVKSSFPTAASHPYASTTDEDDGLTISSVSITNIASVQKSSISSSPSSAGGYFNISSQSYSGAAPTPRRRVSHKVHSHSPSINHPQISQLEDEWDYSETEWWGWLVLCVTWIVFVVGMGSCFGVWSWAWDVGETPYAPPELEDDPTLPIVGYYPALMVMTAVMAWVWVVVAWVGMKYFRHAKVIGD